MEGYGKGVDGGAGAAMVLAVGEEPVPKRRGSSGGDMGGAAWGKESEREGGVGTVPDRHKERKRGSCMNLPMYPHYPPFAEQASK